MTAHVLTDRNTWLFWTSMLMNCSWHHHAWQATIMFAWKLLFWAYHVCNTLSTHLLLLLHKQTLHDSPLKGYSKHLAASRSVRYYAGVCVASAGHNRWQSLVFYWWSVTEACMHFLLLHRDLELNAMCNWFVRLLLFVRYACKCFLCLDCIATDTDLDWLRQKLLTVSTDTIASHAFQFWVWQSQWNLAS